MIPLFTLTLFLSAALLFLVQPLIAKTLLPVLGGTPAVWTTCMLFFQVMLLAGYSIAHFAPRLFGRRVHALVHLALLTTGLLLLPFGMSAEWTPPEELTPVFWLLGMLVISVGLPFLALACSAPLLQTWFSRTGHEAANDPYFLYAASNLGSMLALLCYPLAVERLLTLQDQAEWWQIAYIALIALTMLCILVAWRKHDRVERSYLQENNNAAPYNSSLIWHWIALAFVPSSLLLGVTTYLTTDIASIPLLWVAPLAIYLLTFTLTFARRPLLPHKWMIRVLPVIVLAVTFAMLVQATEPLVLLIGGHVLLLFVVGMVCHGELARKRPPPEHLTGFYFCLALGGALGGVFNGLIAPLLFSGLVEYPLMMVCACLLAPPISGYTLRPVRGDVLWPLAVGVLTVVLVFASQRFDFIGPIAVAVMFAIPSVLCYVLVDRPLRFGLGIAAILIAGTTYEGDHGRTVFQERSFFGVHRVVLNREGTAHVIIHGNTIHGMQWLESARQKEALVYYHLRGPIGAVFAHLREHGDGRPVAVVGLGAGSVATYGQVGQKFTFYEIDPVVIRIATDSRLFTFLRDSPATVDIVLGDARLTLVKAPAKHFGLIVIDAFSSDAIPVHLLTREALAIYRSKMADNGILAFHVSNRYLDLPPILGDLAGDCGMTCLTRDDLTLGPTDLEQGKSPSQWVLLANRPEDLPRSSLWLPQPPRRGLPVWTDDYCNLAGELRFWKP